MSDSQEKRKLEMWLLGDLKPNICDKFLPTNGEVMQHLFYYHSLDRKPFSWCYKKTAEAVQKIWNNAGQQTSVLQNIIRKMKCITKNYERLKKNKKSNADIHMVRRNEFSVKLEKLFNVARTVRNVKSKQTSKFLQDQRTKLHKEHGPVFPVKKAPPIYYPIGICLTL
jgi:hypothetical protein